MFFDLKVRNGSWFWIEKDELRKVDLRRADLRFANLQGADLQYTNLQGADLDDTDLQGANLQGANLQGADLRFANLQGANLQGANLQGANLQGANLDFSTWPLHCGSFGVKVGKRLVSQLLAHVARLESDDDWAKEVIKDVKEKYGNEFCNYRDDVYKV